MTDRKIIPPKSPTLDDKLREILKINCYYSDGLHIEDSIVAIKKLFEREV